MTVVEWLTDPAYEADRVLALLVFNIVAVGVLICYLICRPRNVETVDSCDVGNGVVDFIAERDRLGGMSFTDSVDALHDFGYDGWARLVVVNNETLLTEYIQWEAREELFQGYRRWLDDASV